MGRESNKSVKNDFTLEILTGSDVLQPQTSEVAIPLGEIPTESAITDVYNAITEGFADHRRDMASSFMLIGMRAMNIQVAKFLWHNPGVQVEALDVGCGPGIVTYQYLNQGLNRIVGMDSSPNMIAKAKDLYGHALANGRLDFQVASANERLPFEDESFHLVVASYTVLHWQDIEFSFREIHRVLKPGGAFFLLEPHEERNDLYYRNGQPGVSFFPDKIWVFEWYEGAEEGGKRIAIPTCYRRNSTINEAMQDAGFLGTQIRVPLPDEDLSREFPEINEKFVKAKRMVLFKGFKQNGHSLDNSGGIIEQAQLIGKDS